MGRDFAQMTLLIFVDWLPGVVSAEQLILVPLSLVCKGFWEKTREANGLQAEPSAVVPPPH